MVSIISTIVPLVSTGLTFHFISVIISKGIGNKSTAAFIIGLMAVPGFIIPAVGLIVDRIKPKKLIFLTLTTILLSMLYLIYVQSIVGAAIFMIVYGVASNMQNITINVAHVNYFGRKYLGSIRGLATVFMVVGSALGPLPFALSFDLTTSYNSAIIAMGAISFVGILMSLFIEKPLKVDKEGNR